MPNILIAEDTAGIRELLRRILQAAGHTVVEAAQGQQAVTLAQSEPIDLLITDLFMPEMDGLELIQRFRRVHPTIPILAVSGGAYGGTINVLDVATRLGAWGILDKPFTRKAVLAAVNNLLGQQELLGQPAG